MRAALYARYSSDNQRAESITAQLRCSEEYCARKHYNIVKIYKDEAISGTSVAGRTGFQQMILDSSKKSFEGIVVYQLDRFARNRYDSANYKAKLKKNGVKVLSARENISDDASGILVESVLERNG